MPYAILPEDESVEAALRRIAREEAEGALAAVRGEGDLGPRVHEMRKAVKKLRGLLRLRPPRLPRRRRRERRPARRRAGPVGSARRRRAARDPRAAVSEGMDASRRAALLAPFGRPPRHHDAARPRRLLPAFAEAMAGLRDRSEGWRLATRRLGRAGARPRRHLGGRAAPP